MKYIISLISVCILALGSVSFSFAAETTSNNAVKAAAVAPKGLININTADVEELTKLKGVGQKKAEAIIAWRKENGNFKTVDDLLEVKGIGEATLEANREIISI